MKLIDISQEVFSCAVYPGDAAPSKAEVRRMSRGDAYNLTEFSMCAHNGTHIDAPFHFFQDGKTVEQVPLSRTVGEAYVACHSGEMTADEARAILRAAGEIKKLLIKGESVITLEAAEVFAAAGTELIGVETQTVGPEEAPAAVHRVLLKAETVLLEGLRLGEAEAGRYFLSAAPLCLAGADGAPCRAVLIQFEE